MRERIRNRYSVFVLALFFLCGCAGRVPSSNQLRQVSLGMSKEQVLAILSEPSVVRGSIRNKFDQVIEVWEYPLALPSEDSAGTVAGKAAFTVLSLGIGAITFQPELKDYWLYFLNDELVQWGEAGDWSREPDRIYDFNFNPSPHINR